jgi:hypothetical protein
VIVSHLHRYLFVELPRTGSTAINRELCDHYDGISILEKHSTYHDFLRTASDDEKRYFVFSCIRNPLDEAVSRYFKLKTDHKQRYSHPIKTKYAVGIRRAELALHGDQASIRKARQRRRSFVDRLENRRFRFVAATGADFPTFLLRYYRLPYDNWSRLAHRRFDFLIRFENLEEDFATALRMIGIEPKRPLPVVNRTSEKRQDFWRYYSTPEAIERAKRIFGPFMERWGYAMPSEWGSTHVPWWDKLTFEALAIPRVAYWRWLRGRIP